MTEWEPWHMVTPTWCISVICVVALWILFRCCPKLLHHPELSNSEVIMTVRRRLSALSSSVVLLGLLHQSLAATNDWIPIVRYKCNQKLKCNKCTAKRSMERIKNRQQCNLFHNSWIWTSDTFETILQVGSSQNNNNI